MKYLLATTISALLVLTLTSMTGAYANPGHSIIIAPAIAGPGATFSASFQVAIADPVDIIGPCVFLTYDQAEDNPLQVFNNARCDTFCTGAQALVAPDRCWRLEDANGDEVGLKFPTGSTCGATIDIGDGDPVTPTNLNAPCTAFADSVVGQALVGPLAWNEKPGAGPESTLAIGLYRVISYGFVDNNNNGVYEPGPNGLDNPGEVRESFRVSTPTAGEIIPIDTSALFIAGFVTNPLIMLSTLGVIAAGTFGVLRMVTIKHN